MMILTTILNPITAGAFYVSEEKDCHDADKQET